MFLAIWSLSLIYTIFILYMLFEELQSVGHNFFPKDFLRQILQLPKYNLKGPVRNLFGRD